MTDSNVTKTNLDQELQKVQQQIDALERAIDFEPDFGMGEGDPAITRREMDRALLERLKQRSETLRKAVAGVGQGSYGICSVCGSEIHPGRLAVLPGTRLCVRCSKNGREE